MKSDKGLGDSFAHIDKGHCCTFGRTQEYIVGWFLAHVDGGQCSNCKINIVQGAPALAKRGHHSCIR